MEQQTTQNKQGNNTQMQTSQNPQGQNPGQMQPTGEDKSKWWLWGIIAVVVIAIIVGAFLWLF